MCVCDRVCWERGVKRAQVLLGTCKRVDGHGGACEVKARDLGGGGSSTRGAEVEPRDLPGAAAAAVGAVVSAELQVGVEGGEGRLVAWWRGPRGAAELRGAAGEGGAWGLAAQGGARSLAARVLLGAFLGSCCRNLRQRRKGEERLLRGVVWGASGVVVECEGIHPDGVNGCACRREEGGNGDLGEIWLTTDTSTGTWALYVLHGSHRGLSGSAVVCSAGGAPS